MNQRIKNEIQHGKFIANTGENIWNWTTPAGKIRWKKRVDIFFEFIGDNNNDVLEVGCGTGLFTSELAKTNNHLVAIDISPELLAIAKSKKDMDNVTFKLDDAHNPGFRNASFDFIFGSSILHHLDTVRALENFYRILRPKGKIIFTEPNQLNPQIMLERSHPFFRKMFNNSPDEIAFYRWHLSRQIKKAGFTNIKIHPFDFMHPLIPSSLIRYLLPVSEFIENTPILKEFAGSLIITAEK